MRAKKRVKGFKYVYETAKPDVAVVRLAGNEWAITRGDHDSIAQCCAELVTRAPVWAVENGAVEGAQEEVHRWNNPILYEAMREWG